MTRPLAPWQIALELHAAVASAVRGLPRGPGLPRARLEAAAVAVTQCLNAGRAHVGAPRDVAFQHFNDALAAALAAGVPRHDLVVAFNGDDEK
jgi:hypothetical protein